MGKAGVKEGLNASLRDKEKERQAIEDGFAKANDSWSAEKVLPHSDLNSIGSPLHERL